MVRQVFIEVIPGLIYWGSVDVWHLVLNKRFSVPDTFVWPDFLDTTAARLKIRFLWHSWFGYRKFQFHPSKFLPVP